MFQKFSEVFRRSLVVFRGFSEALSETLSEALSLVVPNRFAPCMSSKSGSCLGGEGHFLSGLQKGPAERATSKNVKNRQKVSKSFSTLFDKFRAGQKTSKIDKRCQRVFRHFSTIFARHLFSGPFCNPLIFGEKPKCRLERTLRVGA